MLSVVTYDAVAQGDSYFRKRRAEAISHCHNYSMSRMLQKLIANYSIRGLAIPRAGDRSFVTDSIHGGSRLHLTYAVAHPGFGELGGGTTGDLGATPPAAHEFLRLTLILADFFIEKGHAVSAITINNAKIFLQLMSKSRSLAKISKRRLQPLLLV